MNKSIMITVLLAITLLSGCSNNKSINNEQTNTQSQLKEQEDSIDKSNMDEVISEYIITHTKYKPTTKQFEAHKIYGMNKQENKVEVYLYSALIGYSFVDDNFKAEVGGNTAILIELLKENGKYKVIKFKQALDDDSVKELFPKEYAEKALNEQHTDLYESIKKQAESWLEMKGKTEKVVDFSGN